MCLQLPVLMRVRQAQVPGSAGFGRELCPSTCQPLPQTGCRQVPGAAAVAEHCSVQSTWGQEAAAPLWEP